MSPPRSTATAPRARRRAPAHAGRRSTDRITLSAIEAGPAGPEIGAIFDFDGTLLAGYSILAFLTDRVRRRDIGLAEIGRTAKSLLEALAGDLDNRELLERGLAEWRGRELAEMNALGERLFAEALEGDVFPEMRARIAAHRRMGHTLVIASSATAFQVEPAARHLGIETVLCTRLEVADGRLTGRVDGGRLLWGPAKARAVQEYAARHRIDLARSYFYADGDEDEALMHLVGEPRPVNPHSRLARVAARRGWPVQQFTSRGRVDAATLVRNAAATASVLPAVAAALAMRALTGSRREAGNLLTSTLPDLMLGLGQVKLAVHGEEHLWSQRPAVFIFNHRNLFDAQIAAKLVQRDFGAVAKQELRRDPLFAIASQFIEIAFLDRDNHRAALEALEPATRLLRQGISMIVAPEGTRARGAEPGVFKKGAFRMAMAAGVPIVPIVIRNAEDLGPRSALMMRPGTVDVAVLPPVPVHDWTRENLDARIAAVRQCFIDTLANWPGQGPARRARGGTGA